MQDEAWEVTPTTSKSQRGHGRPCKERLVLNKLLKCPEGYYVSENRDTRAFKNGNFHVLCRLDGTEV